MFNATLSDIDTMHEVSLRKELRIILAMIFTLSAIIGIILNGMLLIMFWKHSPQLLNSTTSLISTMCSLCLMMSLFNLPMVATSEFFGKWVFGLLGCKIYGFLMAFLGFSIIGVLTCIAFEQYFIIVKHHHCKLMTRKTTYVMSICCISWGTSWATWPLIGWNTYVFTLDGLHTSCAINWNSKSPTDISYTISIFLLCFLMPLILICFFYLRIYNEIKHTYCGMQSSVVQRRSTRRTKEVAKTIFCIICAFILSWTPYGVIALYSAFGDSRNIPSILIIWPAVFAKISVVWNPIIYTFRNKDIRKTLFSKNRPVILNNTPVEL